MKVSDKPKTPARHRKAAASRPIMTTETRLMAVMNKLQAESGPVAHKERLDALEDMLKDIRLKVNSTDEAIRGNNDQPGIRANLLSYKKDLEAHMNEDRRARSRVKMVVGAAAVLLAAGLPIIGSLLVKGTDERVRVTVLEVLREALASGRLPHGTPHNPPPTKTP